jgi:tetratricopeptide (TPR) repeat protein
MGDHTGAIVDFTQAVTLDGSFKLAYYNRGNAYFSLGQYEKAIEDCDKAIALDAYYAEAYGVRGYANAKISKTAAACSDLRKSFDLGVTKSGELLKSYCK